MLPLPAYNVQAILLQSKRVSEIHFPALWRPKLQEFSLRFPQWEHLSKTMN